MKKVKLWLSENGFMGLVSLMVAGGAIVLGMWFIFWGALGLFVVKFRRTVFTVKFAPLSGAVRFIEGFVKSI